MVTTNNNIVNVLPVTVNLKAVGISMLLYFVFDFKWIHIPHVR